MVLGKNNQIIGTNTKTGLIGTL
jgi:hypothetical protein